MAILIQAGHKEAYLYPLSFFIISIKTYFNTINTDLINSAIANRASNLEPKDFKDFIENLKQNTDEDIDKNLSEDEKALMHRDLVELTK